MFEDQFSWIFVCNSYLLRSSLFLAQRFLNPFHPTNIQVFTMYYLATQGFLLIINTDTSVRGDNCSGI